MDEAVELQKPQLMSRARKGVQQALGAIGEQLGTEPATLFTSMLAFIQERRERAWTEMASSLNFEVFDQTVGGYNWYCIEELRNRGLGSAVGVPALAGPLPPKGGTPTSAPDLAALQSLREELDKDFARGLLLWQKSKDELVKEMDSTIQVPGLSNIFTQPIINRIDMLATGVRTMIGVKVFGSDLDHIQAVSQSVADTIRGIPGTVAVVPDQIVGKGYLEITIDREKAARYGVNVGDVQDVIEIALGGKAITEKSRTASVIRFAFATPAIARAGIEQIKNRSSPPRARHGDIGSRAGTGSPRRLDHQSRPARMSLDRVRFRWRASPTSASSKDRPKSRARTGCCGPMSRSRLIRLTWLATSIKRSASLIRKSNCLRECTSSGAGSSSTNCGPIARCGSCCQW
jgi:Cu(I)/Ag(I) efflux system membrane protein CusA/SilA